MARVMVLICGLVLTWFAAVEFFLTPASTSAAVYVVSAGAATGPAAPARGGVTAWAVVMAMVVVSAMAAAPATATRLRIDGMGVGASVDRQ